MTIFQVIVEKFKRLAVTLRFSILTIFVTFFVLAMLSIIVMTYYRFTTSMTSISFRLMKQASNSALQQVVNEMRHAELKGQSIARLFELNVINRDSLSEISNYTTNFMLNEDALFPSVQSLFWGNEEGSFVMAQKENNTVISEVIDRSKKTPTGMFIYRDNSGRIIKTMNSTDFSYDPRIRPWYIAAKKEKKSTWLGVYLYHITRYQGISVATPIYNEKGELWAVINVNIRLDYLRQLIQNIKLSENGTLYIATVTGDILAYPGLVQYRNTSLKHVHSLKNAPWIIQSFDEYKKTGKSAFKFRYHNQDYLATYQIVSGFGPEDWLIGVVIPVSDFVGEIRKTRIIIVSVSLIILMLGIIVVSALTSRVVKPLKQLTKEIELIQNFELTESPPIRSHIKEISYIATALHVMKKGLRSFQKYVPAVLVRQLIESGEDARIGGIKKPIAIFFSDIINFTSITEKTDPELLTQYLCEYFEELSCIILIHRGTIDKYIGDAIMAFWGAPIAEEKSSQQAAKAALQCLKRLNELNKKWELEKRPVLETRIGIHLGDAIVGNLGSSERLNYTAIGDATNIASRLENINRLYGTQIIISQTVYDAIKDQFAIRLVDYVRLKGKAAPSYIYELLAEDKSQLNFDIDAYNQHFRAGFIAYQKGDWDHAIHYFNECLQIYPNDTLTRLFILRCEKFKVHPAPKGWDGVWMATEK
jgi:adenylate cyclase